MEKIIIHGSSKDFYETPDSNAYKVVFKDVVHGRGRESVIAGTGRLREEFCYYFYKFLESQGIETQLVKKSTDSTTSRLKALLPQGFLVQKLEMIPLELIARFKARGHWVDVHKIPLFQAGTLFKEPVVEFCLKWKNPVNNITYEQYSASEKFYWGLLKSMGLSKFLLPQTHIVDDPRVTFDLVRELHHQALDPKFHNKLVTTRDEWQYLRDICVKVNSHLRDFLASQGWILEDGKFEVGRLMDGRIVVGDEYTQDSSRITDKHNNSLSKDLFRQQKSPAEIYDAYAKLTEAIKVYAQ